MSWIVDQAHSSVEFIVRHMMISKVRGRFLDFDGTLEIDEENPQNSTLEGSIRVKSIDTGVEARDTHLRSGDFFAADTHPTIHFRASGITPKRDGEYEVRGDLTIKGTTRELVWEVEEVGRGVDPYGNKKWAFEAETEFDRRDFGLDWNVPLEAGGVLVGNKVKVELTVQLQYQPAQDEVTEEQGELSLV